MKPVKRTLRQIPGPSWKREKSPIPPRRSERLEFLRAKEASIEDSKGFYAHFESTRNLKISLQEAVVQEIKNVAHIAQPPTNVSETVKEGILPSQQIKNAEVVREDVGCQVDLKEPRRTTAPPSESGAHDGQQQGRDGQTGSLDAVDDSAPVTREEGRNTAALNTNRLFKIEPDDIHDFMPDQKPFLAQKGNSTTNTTTSEVEPDQKPLLVQKGNSTTNTTTSEVEPDQKPLLVQKGNSTTNTTTSEVEYATNPGTQIPMPMMTSPPPPPYYHAFPPMPYPCHCMQPPIWHLNLPPVLPYGMPLQMAHPPPPNFGQAPSARENSLPFHSGQQLLQQESQRAAMYSGQGQPLRTQNLPSPFAFLPMAPRSVPGFPQMIFHQFAPPPFYHHSCGHN